MHLSIDAAQAAVRIDDCGGVVVHTGRAPLEQRADDHHSQFARELRERLGRRARDRLRQVEEPGVLLAAKILRAEQFLQADDLRAPARRLADAPDGFGQVFVGVHGAGHLDEADAKLGGVHLFILADRSRDIRRRRSQQRRLEA